MRKLLLSTLAALSLSAPLATVAQAQWGHPPPPALRIEVVPAGRPGYLWRPGYWNWYGGRYVWIGGVYVRHAPGYGRWAPGYWGRRGWYGPRWVR